MSNTTRYLATVVVETDQDPAELGQQLSRLINGTSNSRIPADATPYIEVDPVWIDPNMTILPFAEEIMNVLHKKLGGQELRWLTRRVAFPPQL